MMKTKRDNPKSPNKKSKTTISRPLNRINKKTLIAAASESCISQNSNIKVVVRVRPPNVRESGDNHRNVVKVIDETILIFDPKENAEPFFYHGVKQKTRDFLRKTQKDLQFNFNKIFDCHVQNIEVFENSTKPLITSLMDGINCSVFAYGATGAGKTHTMLGNPSNPGITFLTMDQLFLAKEELSREREFELGITYLEVYNEVVQDLLNPGATLTLREDSKFGVIVAGIKFVNIESSNELFSLLEQGNKNRTQHPTDANAESSRSHAVFQVYLKMKFRVTGEIRMAKLSMIDLAGSERGSATGFHGARFAEGANINKSLLALGNCINSLADGQRHVPYRDSKLTRLLKDSLGGNCQTVMIANISPSSFSYEDTYNTLRYATRAKAIKATFKRNVVNMELSVEKYVKIIDELRKEVARTKEEKQELENKLNQKATPETIDPSIITKVEELFEQRRIVMEKIYSMETSEQLVKLRSFIKEDANARLSGLCINTPDKEERHRKLDNTIYRCKRQKETYREEIDSLNNEKLTLQKLTKTLSEQYPSLKLMIESKENDLGKQEERYKCELFIKKTTIYEEELSQRNELIEKMSAVLKPCFLQLQGMGYATDNMKLEYESLLSHSQGLKNIKWEDNNIDTNVCSSTTLNYEESTPMSKSPLRLKSPEKSPIPPIERIPIGDVTFSVNTPRKTPSKSIKTKHCMDQILVKAYKPSPMKKPKINSASLKMKENVNKTVSRPIQPYQRTQLRKGSESSTSVQSARNVLSTRPPFRR